MRHIHRKNIFIREVKIKSVFTHNIYIYIFDYFIYIYFPLVLVPRSPSLEISIADNYGAGLDGWWVEVGALRLCLQEEIGS